MSTYLLAFIVGEFDYISARGENGVEIRVYTQAGSAESGTGMCSTYSGSARVLRCIVLGQYQATIAQHSVLPRGWDSALYAGN